MQKVGVELDVMVSIGITDRTRVKITIRIKERAGVHFIITNSTLLLVCCNRICAPKPQSRHFLFRQGFFTLLTNFCLYVVKISPAVATVSNSGASKYHHQQSKQTVKKKQDSTN